MINRKYAAALLAACMLLSGACALAQETAPLAVRAQEETQEAERLSPFGSVRSYLGVQASDKWLWQAKLGNRLLNMRMFTPEGRQITFQENLTAASTGGADIRLELRANSTQSRLLLQMDEDAVSTLARLGVTEIAVADTKLRVQAEYDTEDLAALRSVFGVGENELLCVSGETEPVTVVSVDGVRRQITK